MKRGQLNTKDWEDLRNAKVLDVSLEDVKNLDIEDDTLASALDEAVAALGHAGANQKAYVVLAITGAGASAGEDTAKDDEDEGEDTEDEKDEGRSGHHRMGRREQD